MWYHHTTANKPRWLSYLVPIVIFFIIFQSIFNFPVWIVLMIIFLFAGKLFAKGSRKPSRKKRDLISYTGRYRDVRVDRSQQLSRGSSPSKLQRRFCHECGVKVSENQTWCRVCHTTLLSY